MVPARSPSDAAPRGRPKSDAKRLAIVDAARELFLAAGVEATSVDAIAARAGVGKATVYSHFPSKQELFEAVVMVRANQLVPMLEELRANLEAPADVGALLLELGEFLASSVLPAKERGWERMVIAEVDRRPELARTLWRAGPKRVLGILSDVIAKASSAGELRVDDAEVAAEHFVGLLFGLELVRGQMASQPRRTRDFYRQRAADAVALFLSHYGAAKP